MADFKSNTYTMKRKILSFTNKLTDVAHQLHESSKLELINNYTYSTQQTLA